MPQPPNPEQFRLTALPCLFIEHGRIDRYLAPGLTVSEHMRRLGWDPKTLHARVSIDGRFVDEAQWEYTLPRAGQAVVMRCIPGAGGGGGGGGGGKQALQIVAILGVVALALAAPELLLLSAEALFAEGYVGAAALFGPGTLGGLFLSAGIGIGGMLAANANIPTPLPRRALPMPQPLPRLPRAA